MHSDPIADMATRMRNAQHANHVNVRCSFSNVKESILVLLKAKKYIADFRVVKEEKFKELEVVFDQSKANLYIKRISKPGQKVYLKSDQLKIVKGGLGILVVSTSQGVMAGYEAFKKGLGGEVMLEIS